MSDTPPPRTEPLDVSGLTDEELKTQLIDIIEKDGMIKREKLTPDATMESIGVESYDMVMILMGIEDHFGIYISVDTDFSEITTFSDLLELLAERIRSGKSDAPDELPPAGTSGNA